MIKAAPDYNEFDTNKVAKVFSKFSHLKYQAARESSVCTYVTGFKDIEDLFDFLREASKSLRADEISIERVNGFPSRLGWDFKGIHREVMKMLDHNELDAVVIKKIEVRIWWD